MEDLGGMEKRWEMASSAHGTATANKDSQQLWFLHSMHKRGQIPSIAYDCHNQSWIRDGLLGCYLYLAPDRFWGEPAAVLRDVPDDAGTSSGSKESTKPMARQIVSVNIRRVSKHRYGCEGRHL